MFDVLLHESAGYAGFLSGGRSKRGGDENGGKGRGERVEL